MALLKFTLASKVHCNASKLFSLHYNISILMAEMPYTYICKQFMLHGNFTDPARCLNAIVVNINLIHFLCHVHP